jgi:hypothetical protein
MAGYDENLVKIFDGLPDSMLTKALEDRDRLWCIALITNLDVDEISRVTGTFLGLHSSRVRGTR